MVVYECKTCHYNTHNRYNYYKHLKTKNIYEKKNYFIGRIFTKQHNLLAVISYSTGIACESDIVNNMKKIKNKIKRKLRKLRKLRKIKK